jgi:hypothetical protein
MLPELHLAEIVVCEFVQYYQDGELHAQKQKQFRFLTIKSEAILHST